MVKKMESCVFISGRGSNLKSIIESSSNNNFPIKVSLIISNNVKAEGIKYAKKHNIPFKYYSSKNQNFFEKSCINELIKKKIKFICLAGFMKVLSKKFIKAFGYKILNIHPSLLPKYRGLDTHKRVLLNKEKYSGCTVHFVSSKLDSGKIILQKKVLISKNETEKTLKDKILKQEHLLYPKSIISIFK